jgi:hypothetical protein
MPCALSLDDVSLFLSSRLPPLSNYIVITIARIRTNSTKITSTTQQTTSKMLLCGMFPYKFADWVHDLFHKKEPKPEIKRYSYAEEVSDRDLTTVRVHRRQRKATALACSELISPPLSLSLSLPPNGCRALSLSLP